MVLQRRYGSRRLFGTDDDDDDIKQDFKRPIQFL